MQYQTELHRHLDVSIRLSTLLELAQARGLVAQSTSLEAFRDKLVIREPMADLGTVLAEFALFQKVLDRPEVLERVAFEVVEDCHREGTRRAELRFAPNFVGEFNSLSWDDILTGFEAGVARALRTYPDMKAGLLCIAVRGYGEEQVARSVEFFLKHESRFAGLDLAGDEALYPTRPFENAFRAAVARGSKITVHAGEGTDPENIWAAVERLGARRIGHGVSCVRDPKLMDFLRDRRICLEMCPTSNWLTRVVPSIAEHPLPRVLRHGIPVSINTDDPSVFGTTLPREREVCREQMGLDDAKLELCRRHAEAASFLT